MNSVAVVVFALVFAVVGISLIVPGARHFVTVFRLSKYDSEANAEITHIKLKWTNGSFCRAQVVYYADGEKVSGRVCHFIDGETHDVGDVVSVRYDPKHPHVVALLDMSQYRLFSSAFFMMGIGFIVFGFSARLLLMLM